MEKKYIKRDFIKIFVLAFSFTAFLILLAIWDKNSQVLQKIAENWIN